ncbi:hypothetical protein CO666_18525 [Rhizobium chutanense]|uniref:Uncharacterized protein n=1 Tax=Rhizobium chutanense TaxID=2035448 RepID=A0A2A6J9H8_9HYPH|nr:hypothetical protein CO666_18525 [Rhizobium chutanense]
MRSAPIDLQMELRMQTPCQPQTLESSCGRDNVAACLAISSASRSFFRQPLRDETGLSYADDFYIENYLSV